MATMGTTTERLIQEAPDKTNERFFYGLFYGRVKYCCKTVQFYVTLCKHRIAGLPSVSNDMQCSETLRNSLGLNYDSPALTAELQALFHSHSEAATILRFLSLDVILNFFFKYL